MVQGFVLKPTLFLLMTLRIRYHAKLTVMLITLPNTTKSTQVFQVTLTPFISGLKMEDTIQQEKLSGNNLGKVSYLVPHA